MKYLQAQGTALSPSDSNADAEFLQTRPRDLNPGTQSEV